jgi:hypothetical protein
MGKSSQKLSCIVLMKLAQMFGSHFGYLRSFSLILVKIWPYEGKVFQFRKMKVFCDEYPAITIFFTYKPKTLPSYGQILTRINENDLRYPKWLPNIWANFIRTMHESFWLDFPIPISRITKHGISLTSHQGS